MFLFLCAFLAVWEPSTACLALSWNISSRHRSAVWPLRHGSEFHNYLVWVNVAPFQKCLPVLQDLSLEQFSSHFQQEAPSNNAGHLPCGCCGLFRHPKLKTVMVWKLGALVLSPCVKNCCSEASCETLRAFALCFEQDKKGKLCVYFT